MVVEPEDVQAAGAAVRLDALEHDRRGRVDEVMYLDGCVAPWNHVTVAPNERRWFGGFGASTTYEAGHVRPVAHVSLHCPSLQLFVDPRCSANRFRSASVADPFTDIGSPDPVKTTP